MKKITLIVITLLAVSLLGACAKKQEAPAKQVRISSTPTYEKFFGPAPTTDKGTCFAFVIYFPSRKLPGRAIPFPFFTFDESSIKKVAIERLLGGMNVSTYTGEFLQPFPPGVHLLGVTQDKNTAVVNFSKEVLNTGGDVNSGKAALSALALTVSQFPGVTNVRVQVEGKDAQTFLGSELRNPVAPDQNAVAGPSPPRLLSVTAVKNKGEKSVDEVNAYFDRPVEVQELKMTDQSGKALAGDMYHSVFDMAAVLKPKDPSIFKERMPIKVRWSVTDKLGRHAEGDNVWLLEVKEH